ncbi:MAG: MBL fold metallo-hydrolase [Ndongobacter sp.]|nr:MBL fold metallo-hydrolase [Ndongobacter sp.]
MKICSITSGSSGNCVYLETEKSRILIDAGYSGKQLEQLMKGCGINPFQLDAIFVTHEHADHIKGVGVLSRRYRIPVFASDGTWAAMDRRVGAITQAHRRCFSPEKPFSFRDIEVHPFSTHHDAAQPVGYSFYEGEEKVSVLTDTGYIDDRMLRAVSDSQIYYIEANHDVQMLRHGRYPQKLQERILSNLGHMSNVQSAQALTELLRGQGEIVLLAHLSEENNTPVICLHTVVAILEENGMDPRRDQTIVVAPRFSPSPLFSCRKRPEREIVLQGVFA